MPINQVVLEGTLATEFEQSEEDDQKVEFLLCRHRGLEKHVELFPVQLWVGWTQVLSLRKGEPVLVLGHLREECWVEEKTGAKRRRLKIHAIDVTQLGRERSRPPGSRAEELPVMSDEDEIPL